MSAPALTALRRSGHCSSGAHQGTSHKMSVKPLQRYVDEFAGRHAMRPADTVDQRCRVVAGLVGRRLR